MEFCISPLTKPRTLFNTLIEGVYGNSKNYLNLDLIYEEEIKILEEMSEFLNKIAKDPFYPLNLLKRNECNIFFGLFDIDRQVIRFSFNFVKKIKSGNKDIKLKELFYETLFNDLEKFLVENNYQIVIIKDIYHFCHCYQYYGFICKKCKKEAGQSSYYLNQTIKCENCGENITNIIYVDYDAKERFFFTKISQKILAQS
jgi:hypothetical protein